MASDPDDHGPGCDGPLNCTCSDYSRGRVLGQIVKEMNGIFDPRWDIAQEAKGNGDFDEFMRGLNDAIKEEAQ